MQIQLNQKLENYQENHSTPEDEVLAELNRETHLKILMPRMLSGHLQGLTLKMLSQMLAPEKILEIGTFTGYSAICLCAGLKPGGKLHTIEIDDELKPIVTRYLAKANVTEKVELHFGDAMQIIPTLNEMFDLVFIDADKPNYSAYFDLIFDKVRPGGFILADNVLWSGKVVETIAENDAYTKGIVAFNTKIQNDNRVEKVMLPLRDGLFIIRKK